MSQIRYFHFFLFSCFPFIFTRQILDTKKVFPVGSDQRTSLTLLYNWSNDFFCLFITVFSIQFCNKLCIEVEDVLIVLTSIVYFLQWPPCIFKRSFKQPDKYLDYAYYFIHTKRHLCCFYLSTHTFSGRYFGLNCYIISPKTFNRTAKFFKSRRQ